MRLGQLSLVLPFVTLLFSSFTLLSASNLGRRGEGPAKRDQPPPPKRPLTTYAESPPRGSPPNNALAAIGADISGLANLHLDIREREEMARRLFGQLSALCIEATIDNLLLDPQPPAGHNTALAGILDRFIKHLDPVNSPAPSIRLAMIRSLTSNLQRLLAHGQAELHYFAPQLKGLGDGVLSQLRDVTLELIQARLALVFDPNARPENTILKIHSLTGRFLGQSVDDGLGTADGLSTFPQRVTLVACKFWLKILLLMIQSVNDPEAEQLRMLSESLGGFMALLNRTYRSLLNDRSLSFEKRLDSTTRLEASLETLLTLFQGPNPLTGGRDDQHSTTKIKEDASKALRNLQAIHSVIGDPQAAMNNPEFDPQASMPPTERLGEAFINWYNDFKGKLDSLQVLVQTTARERGLLELYLADEIVKSAQLHLDGLPHERILEDVRIDVNSATIHLPYFSECPDPEKARRYFSRLENFAITADSLEPMIEQVSAYFHDSFEGFFHRQKLELEARYRILRLLKGIVHPYQIPEFYLFYWTPLRRLSFLLKNLWSKTLITLGASRSQASPDSSHLEKVVLNKYPCASQVTAMIKYYQGGYEELLGLWKDCHVLTGQETPLAESSSWSLSHISSNPEFKQISSIQPR